MTAASPSSDRRARLSEISSRRSPPSFCLLVLLSFLLPAAGHAQQTGPDSIGPPPPSVVERLDPGDRLRVTAPMAWEAEGRLAAPVEQALLLEGVPGAAGDTLRIPVEAVERLWLRVPATGRGLTYGAVAGGTLGGLAGAVVGAGLCDAADCTAETWEGAARGALLVGASGAAVGALIGSLSERWDRVHP